MTYKNIIFIIILLIICGGQASAYKITASAVSCGGSSASSANYILDYTVGEDAITSFSGTGWILNSGYLYTVDSGSVPADSYPPAAPLLSAPLDNAWTTNQTVTFLWEEALDSSGILQYDFRIALDTGFTSLTTSYAVSSTYTTTTLAYGWYYWSVRAYDGYSNQGSWSNPNTLFVSSHPWRLYAEPAAQELVADNAQSLAIDVRFVEPTGSTAPLSGYNQTINLTVSCGQTVRKSSSIIAVDGSARYYYTDNTAGEMTITAEYDSYIVSEMVYNLVPNTIETTVWCAGDGGLTRVVVPANTFTGNARIDISVLQQDLSFDASSIVKFLPKSGRNITASIGGSELSANDFNNNVTLTIPYEEDSPGFIEGLELDENILNIYRMTGSTPGRVVGTVNGTNDTVSASLDHLSTYFIGWVQPESAYLYPNFPNPLVLGGATSIMYNLSSDSVVSVKIFDVSGDLVRILKDNISESTGQYTISWDGTNQSGTRVAQGVYVCLLDTTNFQDTIKIIVLKE